uniref:Cytochrome c oxidase subunit 3 n=1 Tax=Blattisocius keegani TaxID=2337216 RepID=A0A4Y5QDQ7_9ACAR|nr:cytochrome c oxidase subunit III [Blattisocius keegani]
MKTIQWFHSYHMVDKSPWPFIFSINMSNLLLSFIIYYMNNSLYMKMSMSMVIMIILFWTRDIFRESTFQGHHTKNVSLLMKTSMLVFISSELMFFFSFFWAYFYNSLNPSYEIGNMWPSINITMFNPFNLPLLNTLILLSSGMTITWSHFSLLNNKLYMTMKTLILTLILGLLFSYIQLFEYKNSLFSLNDSIFGSIFYMLTGFHGSHVIFGSMFIFYNFILLILGQINSKHHFSFEASIWYWHFVDIIWLFLYIFLYWFYY